MDFIIYKITDVDTGRIYVGSTTRGLKERIRVHKAKSSLCVCKDFNWGSVEIEILEEGCSDDRRMRERYHMEQYDCCNKLRAYASKEENRARNGKYQEKNREKVREKNRERNRVRVECECGTVIRKGDLPRHRKTKKHIKLISN